MKKHLTTFCISFILLIVSSCGNNNIDQELSEVIGHNQTEMDNISHEHIHEGHDDAESDYFSHAHKDEEVIDLTGLSDLPEVSVVATPNEVGGVILDFELENFELVSLNSKKENQLGRGHLHLELDGKTLAMLTEKKYELSNLSNGEHEVSVSLSAVDHSNFYLRGAPIEDKVTFTIAGGKESRSPEASFEVEIFEGNVLGGLQRLEVAIGEFVEITVKSDVNDEVHLHVYDLRTKVSLKNPAIMRLEANIPGVFEAEMHSAGFRIFELKVS